MFRALKVIKLTVIIQLTATTPQPYLSTSCVALSEMAVKMLSNVLCGSSGSAFKKCVMDVTLVGGDRERWDRQGRERLGKVVGGEVEEGL